MKLRSCKSELCEYEKRQAPKEEFSPHAQTCNKCKERQAKEGNCEKILYGRWKSIKKRCNNPNSKYYNKPDIVVCKEWADSFKSFYLWAIQNNFEKGLTIERIDNELGYSPENCMWITLSEQTRNKRNVKLNFETAEEIRRAKEKGALTKDIAEFYGVSCSFVNAIVKKRYWNKNDAGEKIYEPDEVTQGVKIDAEKAKEIRNLWHTTDKTQKEIGELYGLKGCSVSNILKNVKQM